MHFSDSVLRTPLRSVPVGIRFQIRLKHRLEYQLSGSLHDSIPDTRNAEFSHASSVRLRDLHPPHRLRLNRSRSTTVPVWLASVVSETLAIRGRSSHPRQGFLC